ncbi:MAG TPA: hypothetical protein VFG50_09955 [Rhodothermales bacterium]|nr:hypothetical protein [Rhodothermales bacterium]
MAARSALMQDVQELAQSIADNLGRIDGIVAVSLDDPWASGEAVLDADITLGLYYRDTERPRVEALRDLAYRLNSSLSGDVVTDFWAQGPILNGGAMLWVEGRRIDWQYRETEYVRGEIEQARRGIVMGHYQAGYPNGFFSHYLVGIVNHCRPLFDPVGELADLKLSTSPYPPELKEALLRSFSREADLTLFAAQRAAAEEDIFYTTGCLDRCVSCLAQMLFAYNEQYLSHERGAVERLMDLAHRPDHFAGLVSSVLGNPGGVASKLQESVGQLQSLASEIQLEYIKPLGI